MTSEAAKNAAAESLNEKDIVAFYKRGLRRRLDDRSPTGFALGQSGRFSQPQEAEV